VDRTCIIGCRGLPVNFDDGNHGSFPSTCYSSPLIHNARVLIFFLLFSYHPSRSSNRNTSFSFILSNSFLIAIFSFRCTAYIIPPHQKTLLLLLSIRFSLARLSFGTHIIHFYLPLRNSLSPSISFEFCDFLIDITHFLWYLSLSLSLDACLLFFVAIFGIHLLGLLHCTIYSFSLLIIGQTNTFTLAIVF
jgi:hypothetical protein